MWIHGGAVWPRLNYVLYRVQLKLVMFLARQFVCHFVSGIKHQLLTTSSP